MRWTFAETELLTAQQLTQMGEWARSGGFDPSRTFVTGAAKAS